MVAQTWVMSTIVARHITSSGKPPSTPAQGSEVAEVKNMDASPASEYAVPPKTPTRSVGAILPLSRLLSTSFD